MRRFVRSSTAETIRSCRRFNADGSPQSSVMWIGRDGDDLLFCTVAGRQKERNLQARPAGQHHRLRPRDPLSYAEIRGTATITTEDALKLDDELSFKYDNKPKDPDPAGFVRVVVRVTPNEGDGLRRVTGDWPISRLTNCRPAPLCCAVSRSRLG